MHNDSTFITCAIDAKEGRDVMVVDLPGAFLHALRQAGGTKKQLLMVLRGPLAETMVLLDPTLYRPFITHDKNGVAVLYVEMDKALYGLLESALDFYLKLSGELKEKGYKINPYDPCVANKTVKGAQHTVIWHVDDLKCSHVDPFVNTLFAKWLSSIYGPKIRVNRGKRHDYLGVDFDWSEPGKCKVSMIKYMAQIIADFPEKIDKTATTGGGDNLYKIRDPDDPNLPQDFYLPEQLAQAFHHTLAQLLFAS